MTICGLTTVQLAKACPMSNVWPQFEVNRVKPDKSDNSTTNQKWRNQQEMRATNKPVQQLAARMNKDKCKQQINKQTLIIVVQKE